MATSDVKTYITFPTDFSDGDPSKWPGAPYTQVPVGSPNDILWKDKTGQAVAYALGYPDSDRYSIRSWPTGYAMFANPRSDTATRREDYYLIGGPKKFRSSSEFIEHALWLLFHGQPPGYLTERLSSLRASGKPRKSHPSSSSPIANRHLQSRVSSENVESDDDTLRLKETPKAQRKTISARTSHMTVVEVGDGDSEPFPPLREQLAHPKRRYRIGELVWCVIDPPIRGETPSHTIDMWPGIVETYRFRKKILSPQIEENVEFTVHETVLFQVKLLALTDTFQLPQSHIYPYKVYVPKADLIGALQSLPAPHINDIPRELYHFHQNLTYLSIQHSDADMVAPSDTFVQATGPFSLALQNAAHLARLWGFVYPQIQRGRAEAWNEESEIHYSGLWWGAELIYVGEMVSLIMNHTQLGLHPSMANILINPTTNDTGAVLLQLQRIIIQASPSRLDDKRKAFARGPLFVLVSASSGIQPDSADLAPNQAPPEGFMWKRLLPQGYEVQISIQLIAGRYYEDDIGDILRGDHVPQESSLVLRGMVPGYYCGNTLTDYVNNRADMARNARRDGQEDLAKYWNGTQQYSQNV